MASVRHDATWLCVVGVALAGLCGLPYVVSALFGPADLQRIGTFWFTSDFSQYEAAMREGASQTSWLIHDHLSAEPHSAAFVFPLYVATGKLSALIGLSGLTTFIALEWLGRLAVLGAVYAFASTFVESTAQRRLAVLLTLGTLGLDAPGAVARMLLDASGVHALDGALPETISPYLEMSSFGVLLSAPHLMLGLALTLVCAPVYLRAIDLKARRRGLWLSALGVAFFGLSLVHPFNAPMLVSVLVTHALLSGRRAWPAAVVAGLAVAPIAAYSVVLFQLDSFWSGTYGTQNRMPSPAPGLLPLDFGLVMLAAPLAWRTVRRWPDERRRLLLVWVGLGLVWLYVPAPYQRRFAFGVQPALAVLASVGLLELNTRLRARRVRRLWGRLINYATAMAGVSTSVLVYVSLVASAMLNRPAEVYMWSRPEATAATWLGANSTGRDVVMASTEFGNPLSGDIDGRVVHGHTVATLHSDLKAALVRDFYASDAPSQARTNILRQSGVTIVALGPAERALGITDLTSQPGMRLVFDSEGVQFFRVEA